MPMTYHTRFLNIIVSPSAAVLQMAVHTAKASISTSSPTRVLTPRLRCMLYNRVIVFDPLYFKAVLGQYVN